MKLKPVLNCIAKLGGCIDSICVKYDKHLTEKKPLGNFPEIHSDDFMPELKQEFHFQDALYKRYLTQKEMHRVYMPLRHNKPDINTKYLDKILDVVMEKLKHLVSIYLNQERSKT